MSDWPGLDRFLAADPRDAGCEQALGTDRPCGLGVAGRAGLDRCGHCPPGARPEAPRRQRDPHHPHPPVLVRLLRAHIAEALGTHDTDDDPGDEDDGDMEQAS
jgi:hypothetical protein